MGKFRAAARGTTFGRGGNQVTVKGDLAQVIDDLLEAAAPVTKRVLGTAAKDIAEAAVTRHYKEVDPGRDSARSGAAYEHGLRLPNTHTIEAFVVNTDPNMKYIHRPGPNSTKSRRATATERAGGSRPFIHYPNPKASDGKYLWQELVIKPGKGMTNRIAADLADEIAAKAGV